MSPAVTLTAPATSRAPRPSRARDSGTWRAVISTTAAVSGTLMKNTSRHETAAINHPPTKGPAAAATPLSPDHAPIARGRSCETNDACNSARLPGVSSAPPTPCSPRASTSVLASGARPQSADARPNHTAPMTNTRRRPNRSPRLPPSSSRPARVRVYAVTTHCSPSTPTAKSRPMAGRRSRPRWRAEPDDARTEDRRASSHRPESSRSTGLNRRRRACSPRRSPRSPADHHRERGVCARRGGLGCTGCGARARATSADQSSVLYYR